MAAFRTRGQKDVPVDPFTAGEPDLPWEEPDALVADDEQGDPELAADGARGPGSPARLGEPAPGRHRGARVPRRRGGAPAPGRRARRDGRGCVVALVVLVLMAGSLVTGLVMALLNSDGPTGDFGDIDLDTPAATMDADERAALDALEARLGALLADPSESELREALAAYLDQRCAERLGLASASLGIDADAWAAQLLGEVSWEADEAFTFGDGTGTAWVYLTCPSAYDAFAEFYDVVWPYLDEQGLVGYGAPADATLTQVQRDEVARLLDEAQAVDVTGSEMLEGFDVAYEDGAWEVDDGQVVEDLLADLGVY